MRPLTTEEAIDIIKNGTHDGWANGSPVMDVLFIAYAEMGYLRFFMEGATLGMQPTEALRIAKSTGILAQAFDNWMADHPEYAMEDTDD